MGFQAQNVPPIIDFTRDSMKPGTSCWLWTSNEVVQALEEYGCFIALYDKVSTEQHTNFFGSLKELLDLPLETKLRTANPDKPYLGYLGTAPTRPCYESLGFKDATTVEAVVNFTQQVLPSGNEHLCETMHSYANLVSELEQMINKMVFERYGVEKLYESHVGSTTYILRLMKYKVPNKEETNVGIGGHVDMSFMTIVRQMNPVNGLEIRTKTGEWIAVKFPPSSFIVLPGKAFLAWSNDRAHPATHQVILSGDEERYSMALFSFVNGMINTPEEFVDDEHPRRYNAYNHFGSLDSKWTKK